MSRYLSFVMTALITAYRELRRNTARSSLTLIGIMIGSAAVVMVMSAGSALKSFVLGQVAIFGSDYIHIEIKTPIAKKASIQNAVSLASGITITTLTIKDLTALMHTDNVRDGYAALLDQELVSNGDTIKKSLLYGVSASMPAIERTQLSDGRFFTSEEDDGIANVAVLGSKVKEKLFGDASPVGKDIRIRGEVFHVIGVMGARGSAGFFDLDSLIYVPVKTVQKRLLGVDYISYIMVSVKDVSRSEDTAEALRYILRDRHHITDPSRDDFAVTTQAEAQKMITTIIGGVTLLLLALVCVSLVVGGVGIMNVMYVSVIERTYEIGVRKAVGARNRDILYQFLFESAVMTVTGGLLGACAGILASFAVGVVASLHGFPWAVSISWWSIALAGGFAAVIGIAFGLYPARCAALLNPIEALRNE